MKEDNRIMVGNDLIINYDDYDKAMKEASKKVIALVRAGKTRFTEPTSK